MNNTTELTESEQAAVATLKAALDALPKNLSISVDSAEGIVEINKRTSHCSAVVVGMFRCAHAFF
ncbi:MAG: hypothetical protein EPN21_07955 [Methylococcaceae bacterium]|nr:MAG: hypothetical protein EPN21_07955 [Methylococcaceae bacterium]